MVGALALVIGALALGALTSTEPEAAPSTTTPPSTTLATIDQPIDYDNFTISQIAVGEPLEWTKAATVEDGWPPILVSQLGLLYMFTPMSLSSSGEVTGLHVYRSFDGSSWDDLGPVFTEGSLVEVAATPFGLMAIQAESSGSLVAWISTDAINWNSAEITDDGPGRLAFYSSALGATDSLVALVSTTYGDDVTPVVSQALANLGIDVDIDQVPWQIESTGGGTNLVLYGPLSLPAVSVPLDELGLSPEDRRALEIQASGSGQEIVLAWSTRDGTNWVESTVAGANWVDTIVTAPDGALLAFGGYSAGQTLWRTYDGITWEQLPFGLRAGRAAQWRGQLAGLTTTGRPEVLISADGETWSETGLARLFPTPINWYANDITASHAGIFVTVQGYQQDRFQEPADAAPVELERNGYTLSLEFQQGIATLSGGGETRTWNLYESRSGVAPGVAIDLEARTVTFTADDGEALAVFGFDELQTAENRYWSSTYPAQKQVDGLAYSADGVSWSIQDLDEAFGDDAFIVGLIATGDVLVAAVIPELDASAWPVHSSVEVWAAPLP